MKEQEIPAIYLAYEHQKWNIFEYLINIATDKEKLQFFKFPLNCDGQNVTQLILNKKLVFDSPNSNKLFSQMQQRLIKKFNLNQNDNEMS